MKRVKCVPAEDASWMEKTSYWLWEKTVKTKEWIKEHKKEIMVLGPMIIGTGTAIVKIVGKRINLHKSEELKNLYCYDRSLGHYWELKRKLSNDEWITIEARRGLGEKLGDILDDMGVLAKK